MWTGRRNILRVGAGQYDGVSFQLYGLMMTMTMLVIVMIMMITISTITKEKKIFGEKVHDVISVSILCFHQDDGDCGVVVAAVVVFQ